MVEVHLSVNISQEYYPRDVQLLPAIMLLASCHKPQEHRIQYERMTSSANQNRRLAVYTEHAVVVRREYHAPTVVPRLRHLFRDTTSYRSDARTRRRLRHKASGRHDLWRLESGLERFVTPLGLFLSWCYGRVRRRLLLLCCR